MDKITTYSLLARISRYPPHPLQMFRHLLERTHQKTVPMNVATIDKEFGILNRTVMYRGIVDGEWICFVTERNSRKYNNLKQNPKLSVTMLFNLDDQRNAQKEILRETWQIRLFDAEAVELDDCNLQRLWQEEPIFAKIRSHICECGKPENSLAMEQRCEKLLQMGKLATEELKQTKTYTAFKILARRWDFYKSEPDKIADRLQYVETKANQWTVNHVNA